MSADDQALGGSQFFFPLRTNVGYFDAPEGYFSLVERIKQASLLYDELIFENGIYYAAAGDTGHYEITLPYDSEHAEIIMKSASRSPTGSSMVWLETEEGAPVSIPFSLGSNIHVFRSEFHSTLRELDAENLPWISLLAFELTDAGKDRLELIREQFKAIVDDVAPDIGRHLKKHIVSGFSKDIALTSAMQSSVSMNAMYVPILQRKAQLAEAEGFASLQVTLPNLSQVGWDEILDLRKEKSLIQLREMLSSLEQRAQLLLSEGDANGLSRETAIHQAFIDEWSREHARGQPRMAEAIGDAILDLVLGFIPGLSAFINFARAGDKREQAKQSWVAAFQRLRPPER